MGGSRPNQPSRRRGSSIYNPLFLHPTLEVRLKNPVPGSTMRFDAEISASERSLCNSVVFDVQGVPANVVPRASQ